MRQAVLSASIRSVTLVALAACVVAGLLAPVVVPVLALVLHQAGVVEIPFLRGTVTVMTLAGFVSGFLLRSTIAAGYIFTLWAIWAVVTIATDNARYDPPAEVAVLYMLPLSALPAILAALLGTLSARYWMTRGTIGARLD